MDSVRDVWLDTDIGTDIDDAWALAFLLKSPELALKGVSTVTGDTSYRRRIAERLLRAAGNSTAVLPGKSAPHDEKIPLTLSGYCADAVPRGDFSGERTPEKIGSMLGSLKKKPAVLAIGPMTNLAEMLKRVPGCERPCDLIAMAGLFEDSPARPPEYNIEIDADSARTVLAGEWKSITFFPFEVCRLVTLPGTFVELLESSGDPLCVELARQNGAWSERVSGKRKRAVTSPLFDTAPVAFAYDESFFHVRDAKIEIAPDGRTLESRSGRNIRLAYEWRDQAGFLDLLQSRLLPGTGTAGKFFPSVRHGAASQSEQS